MPFEGLVQWCTLVILTTWEMEVRRLRSETIPGRKRETNPKNKPCLMLVAHAYNPSYSEGKDQEDHSS
jgi:hypothetical protein